MIRLLAYQPEALKAVWESHLRSTGKRIFPARSHRKARSCRRCDQQGGGLIPRRWLAKMINHGMKKDHHFEDLRFNILGWTYPDEKDQPHFETTP